MSTQSEQQDYCDLCWDAQGITLQFLAGESFFQLCYPARFGSALFARLTREGWRLAEIFPLIEENTAAGPPSRFCYHFRRPAKQHIYDREQIEAI